MLLKSGSKAKQLQTENQEILHRFECCRYLKQFRSKTKKLLYTDPFGFQSQITLEESFRLTASQLLLG
jgi:hypothetical protein